MKSYEGEYLSFATIPMAEGWARRRSAGVCRLVCLDPDINEAILSGQEAGVMLERLTPEGFSGQREAQSQWIRFIG